MAVKDKVKINIGIAVKNELFLKSFPHLLHTEAGYPVVAAAKTGPEFFKELSRAHVLPNVCIVDVAVPGSYKVVADIKKNWPEIKVIVLAGAYTDYLAIHMVLAGANAVLSRYSTVKELLAAIDKVMAKNVFHSKLIPKDVYKQVQEKELFIAAVTGRQLEMLQNCTTSANYAEIAVKMGITARGVDTLKETLFKKFSVKNRTDLVMIALRAGIISAD